MRVHDPIRDLLHSGRESRWICWAAGITGLFVLAGLAFWNLSDTDKGLQSDLPSMITLTLVALLVGWQAIMTRR